MKRSALLRRHVPLGVASARRRRHGGPRVTGRPALSVEEWQVLKMYVLVRDHARCRVPWCSRWVADPHHVVKCSAGGPDHEDNVVSLCRDHHRQTDAPFIKGRLVITARGDGEFTFDLVRKADKWAAAAAVPTEGLL